jgi:P pilus assembly chaperone PapD
MIEFLLRPRARRLLAGLVCTLALSASAARAEIALSQIIVDFEPDSPPVHDVELRNLDEERAFVEVTAARIANPGGWPLERRTAANPADLGLVVTPAKVVLGPKGVHVLRLILTRPAAEEERIYRVAVVPKVGQSVDSRSGVKVVVGYEMLVVVRPQQMKVALQTRRAGRQLTLTNTGNTNVLVPTLRQCRGGGCKTASGLRIYAGRTETIALPEDGPVEALMTVGRKTWTETID